MKNKITKFNITTAKDGIVEIPVLGQFNYNERLWVIHHNWISVYGIDEYYVVSDYLTGMCIENFEDTKRSAKEEAIKILDKNKNFDFSGFKAINTL